MYGSKKSFPHTCNVLAGTITRNDAGQKVTEWLNTGVDVRCSIAPVRSDNRVVPTIEDQDMLSVLFPKVIFDDLDFTYASRISDMKDRKGNVLYAGDYTVKLIQKILSSNGYCTEVRVVVEGVIE